MSLTGSDGVLCPGCDHSMKLHVLVQLGEPSEPKRRRCATCGHLYDGLTDPTEEEVEEERRDRSRTRDLHDATFVRIQGDEYRCTVCGGTLRSWDEATKHLNVHGYAKDYRWER